MKKFIMENKVAVFMLLSMLVICSAVFVVAFFGI